MTEKQLGLVLISPMIMATAFLLWRQRALGLGAVIGICAATLFIAVFLFVMQ